MTSAGSMPGDGELPGVDGQADERPDRSAPAACSGASVTAQRGEEVDVQGRPDAVLRGRPADRCPAGGEPADGGVVDRADVAGIGRRPDDEHRATELGQRRRRTSRPARRSPARPRRPAGTAAGSGAPSTRSCGSQNQLETASIAQLVEERAESGELSRSWRPAAGGLPSGSQRPVPVVSSTPSKPAIDIVLSARSCCFAADEVVELGLPLVDRVGPSDVMHAGAYR